MSTRNMHLIGYLKTGPTALHSGGWRHPEATLDDIFDPVRYEQAAQLFEAAKFDGIFFADLFGVADTYQGLDMFVRAGGQNSYLDPMMVLPIMARVTSHLGLGATISTSFFNAFQIARSLASVDMLSGGRVAWNVVTSTNNLEAKNAGMMELPPHDERYDRADEMLEGCMALWRTWDRDPFVFDKEAGCFADPAKVRYADYEGRWVRTRGPLPTPQSPQGNPVIMQAGSSGRGRDFAARWAEIVFAPGDRLEAMREFRQDMHERLRRNGRDPKSCKILVSITPILGETRSIAEERAAYIDSLEDRNYDLAYASLEVGADLSRHKTAEEIAAARGVQGTQGQTAIMMRKAEMKKVSVADVASKKNGDTRVIGTAAMVADVMQELFQEGACDGFIVMPTVHPVSHEQFCRSVVPELQKRGIFRTQYGSRTLRGNLLQ